MTPPVPIDYRSVRTLRINELSLMSDECQRDVQSRGDTVKLDDECVFERQCIDEKNMLEDLLLVLKGCVEQSNSEACADREAAARQAIITQCGKNKTAAVESESYRQQRIRDLLNEVRTRAWGVTSDLYREGRRVLVSPDCDEKQRGALLQARYGAHTADLLHMYEYAMTRWSQSCEEESRAIDASYEVNFRHCLETTLTVQNRQSPEVPNQCVGRAVEAVYHAMWSPQPAVSVMLREWGKLYLSVQLFADGLLRENERALTSLNAALTEAEAKHLPSAITLREQVATLRATIAAQAIPVLDASQEVAAHRVRGLLRVQEFQKRIPQ